MSARKWEESNEETSTEEERRFEEALRQLGADTPVSPDFCARVLAAAQPAPPTSAASESTAVPLGTGRARRRFQLLSRLSPAISVLAAGLVLSLAMNVWWGFRVRDMATLRQELATAQAQVRAAQADRQQLQAHLADMTRQLAALQEQVQRERQQAQESGGASARATRTLPAVMAQDRVRAKIGIGIQVRPGELMARIKSTERLKPGDFLRVYVVPEGDAYVYVVHNVGKNLSLLNAQNATTRVPGGVPVILPAPEKFYQIDGGSDKESITVICSSTELHEVASLFSTPNVSQQNWLSLEKTLLDKSKIDLAQPADKPFQIAGNVRSMSNNDSFLNTLAIYSGKSLVMKKYDFQVQK
jgi:hypothetical protein